MTRAPAIVEELNLVAAMFVAEQTLPACRTKLGITMMEAALTTSLTPQQISILRRVGDGLGLPAYVFRPRNCAQDVELLLLSRLIASSSRGLSIEPAGAEYLMRFDSAQLGTDEQLVRLRVVHERDHSISVEHWPQEY
jgi:hypothetical protein